MMSIMNYLRYMRFIRTGKKAECFFKLKLLVFSYNNVFSNNNISINVYR